MYPASNIVILPSPYRLYCHQSVQSCIHVIESIRFELRASNFSEVIHVFLEVISRGAYVQLLRLVQMSHLNGRSTGPLDSMFVP